MKDPQYGRLVLAAEAGASIDRTSVPPSLLPQGINLFTGADFEVGLTLAEPFDNVVVIPEVALFRGQIIGVLTGRHWSILDKLIPNIPQTVPPEVASSVPETPVATGEVDDYYDTTDDVTISETSEIVEGLYQTGLQLHVLDAPLWAEATPTGKGVQITLPCQWPAHVRLSAAKATGLPARAVRLDCNAPSGNRDGALTVPAVLAALSSVLALRLDTSLRIAMRYDQSFLTGGRAPSRVVWASRLSEDGLLVSNALKIHLNLGAYPLLVDEMLQRLRIAATSVYRPVPTEYQVRLVSTEDIPMGAFEGVASAQLSFAREVHYNRLAEIVSQDPIHWRVSYLRQDWPVIEEICSTLAREADFHRRYSANELVKKRRNQLSLDTPALRGIGFALAQQQSGFSGDREGGTVTVRLNQDGTADLFCSVPSPTLRLHLAWRQLVAHELDIETEAVNLQSHFDSSRYDGGPRLFSRGVSIVSRAIVLACQAIQKRRFRDPLPITVRRTIRPGQGTRSPVDSLKAVGAAGVEAVLHPMSMEIDVRSVTMVIYAGRILDRGMAEAELRRGIYHALNWTLRESLLDAELISEPGVFQTYSTAFRGAVPSIKIVFLNQIRKDGPVGIGELPFNTIPAALVSALSQATGLYLDSLPVRPAHILRQLQEE